MICCKSIRADDSRALTHLSWSIPAASGCIPARELEQNVEALLGRRAFAERADAHHELIGVVERRKGEWFAVLQAEGASQHVRELNAEGVCASLNRPLAIVVATLLDNWADPFAYSQAKRALSVGLVLDAQSGTLPGWVLGARLVGLFAPGPTWPVVRGHAGAWLPDRVTERGMGARFQAFQVGVAVCPVLVSGRTLTLALCAGVELGALQARALGLSSPREPMRLIVSLPLEAALSVHLFEHGALRVELGPNFAALRPTFYFRDADQHLQPLHRVNFWGGSARIGLIADLL